MSTDDHGKTTTRVTRKGQVTIPKALREEYGLEEGDTVVWTQTEDGITVRKATTAAGRGLLLEDDVAENERNRIANELETRIREQRRAEWQPE